MSGSPKICLNSILGLKLRGEATIIIEVISQVDAHRVRGIALTPTAGLARGAEVINTGQPLQVPVGRTVVGASI